MKLTFPFSSLSARRQAPTPPQKSKQPEKGRRQAPVKVPDLPKGLDEEALDNTGTLDTMLPVQLSPDDYQAFVSTVLPRQSNNTKSSMVTAPMYFQAITRSVAASYYVNSVLNLMRWIALNGRRISQMPEGKTYLYQATENQFLEHMRSSIIRGGAAEPAKAAAIDLMQGIDMLVASASHVFADVNNKVQSGGGAVIRDFPDGSYSVDFVGLSAMQNGTSVNTLRSDWELGARIGSLGDNSFPSNDAETRRRSVSDEALDDPLTKAALDTIAYILKYLFGSEAISASGATRRLIGRFELDTDFEGVITNAVMTNFKKAGTLPYLPPYPSAKKGDNLGDHTAKHMRELVRIVFVREPDASSLRSALAQVQRQNSGQPVEPVNFDDVANLLSLRTSSTIGLHLPEKYVRFITQAPAGEKPSLMSMFTWAARWQGAYIRPYTGRYSPAVAIKNAPKYVLKPSAVAKLVERRKELGLYTEESRANEDGLTVDVRGGLQFLPNASEYDPKTALEYEALLESALAVSYANNATIGVGSVENKFIDLDRTATLTRANALMQLRRFAGRPLVYSWDYNCIIQVNADQTTGAQVGTRAVSIGGSAVPDELNIADFLRQDAMSALCDIVPSSGFGKHAGSLVNSTELAIKEYRALQYVIRLYFNLVQRGLAEPVDVLLGNVCADLGYKSRTLSDANAYDKNLYSRYLRDNLSLAHNIESEDMILGIIGAAMKDARGEPGSNLLREVSTKGEDLTDDNHFFKAEFHTLAEIKNVYNYFGGRVMFEMCKSIVGIPRSYFLQPEEQGEPPDMNSVPFVRLSTEAMPLAIMLARYVPSSDDIYAKANELEARNQPNDAFDLDDFKFAGCKEGTRAFPHQVRAFSALSNFPRFAVLDIAPGGGKTFTVLADIANMKAHGKIKRPLVLCPDNLVKDWYAEMHAQTQGKWNIICLNTTVFTKRWGDQRLTELILNAPENTIVVCGHGLLFRLHTRKYQIIIGQHTEQVSHPVEFMRKFGFDYIAIDESHRGKNSGDNSTDANREPSSLHLGLRALTTQSCVKYVRLATGTLIYNTMIDAVGQAMLFNAQIFRTIAEFRAQNSDGSTGTWREDTPFRARQRLSKLCSLISAKRKEWAFMLPIPLEKIHTVELVKSPLTNPDEFEKLGHERADAHQKMYEAVLESSLEAIKQDPNLKKVLGRLAEAEAKDKDGAKNSSGGKDDVGEINNGDEEDSADLDELAAALTPYLQRLDRILVDPFGDVDLDTGIKFGEEFLGELGLNQKNFVSNVVLKVIEIIRGHFQKNQFRMNAEYSPQDIVDFDNQTWIARPDSPQDDPTFVAKLPPNKDKENWKAQTRGKVIVFCRYTRNVRLIYDALPADLRKMAVMFNSQLKGDTASENLEAFKKDDKVQIIIANEQAISEGQNLQMASRLIRVDTPWAPGELDQAMSRLFRPDPKNKFKRETIFLDWVIAEKTIAVTKLGRLISKMVVKAKFDEANNPLYSGLNSSQLPVIKMSMDSIAEYSTSGSIMPYITEYQKLASIQAREFLDMRKSASSQMQDLPQAPMLEDAEIIDYTPYTLGITPVDRADLGLVRYVDYIQRDVEDADDVESYRDPDAMIGLFAHCEFGSGVITNVRRRQNSKKEDGDEDGGDSSSESATIRPLISSVTIQLPDGTLVKNVPASMLYVPTKITDDKLHLFKPVKPNKGDKKREKEAENDIAKEDQRRNNNAGNRTSGAANGVRNQAGASGAFNEALNNLADKLDALGGKVKPPKPPKPPRVGTPAPRVEESRPTHEANVFASLYNGFWCIEIDADETTDTWLRKTFKFQSGVDMVLLKFKNGRQYNAALDYLDDKFTIAPKAMKELELLADAFETSGRAKAFRFELAPLAMLPQFHQVRHRMIQGGTPRKPAIRPYPMVFGDELLIVVDPATCPRILSHVGKVVPGTTPQVKWLEAESLALKFFNTRTDLLTTYKEMKKAGLVVLNDQAFLDEIEKIKTYAPRRAPR